MVFPILILVAFKKFEEFLFAKAEEFLVPFHQVDVPKTARIKGVPGRISHSPDPLCYLWISDQLLRHPLTAVIPNERVYDREGVRELGPRHLLEGAV